MANLRRLASRMQAKEENARRKEHEEEYQASLKELGEGEKRRRENFFQLIGTIFCTTSLASKDKIQEDQQSLLTKVRQ